MLKNHLRGDDIPPNSNDVTPAKTNDPSLDELSEPGDISGSYTIKSIFVDNPLSSSDLEERLKEEGQETRTFYWTRLEASIIEQYAPSVYHAIADELDLKEMAENPLYFRLALQVESRMVNEQSVVDAAILRDRKDLARTVASKVSRWNKACKMLKLLQVKEIDYLEEDEVQDMVKEGRFHDLLVDVKLRYVDAFNKLIAWSPDTWRYPVVKNQEMSSSQINEAYPYVPEVVELLGADRVSAIVLYGSGARQTDQSLINDYDNYLVIEDGKITPKLYELLRSRQFTGPNSKSVGFNVLEKSNFAKFMRMEHDSFEALKTNRVLYGRVEFPDVHPSEVNERGISHAVIRLVSLKAAASWAVRDPEVFRGADQLFEYYQKTQRFIFQTGLNYTEGLKIRDKKELDEKLRELGGTIHPYQEDCDSSYYLMAICDAATTATRLFHHFFGDKRFEMPTSSSLTVFSGEDAWESFKTGGPVRTEFVIASKLISRDGNETLRAHLQLDEHYS